MSQVLKVVTSRNEVQEILYTNIRIQESDNLEIRRQKRALKRSVSLYLRSKRRCVEALIQNNFTARDWYCTLTFTEDRLPPEKVKADFRFAYFIKQLRRQGCTDMKYLKVLEHKHGDGRFHFHTVLSGVGLTDTLIRGTWGAVYGHAHVSQLRPWDVPGLARYISKEAPDIVNKRSYSRSRPPNGLVDPVVKRLMVPDDYRMVVPFGCRLIEREPRCENAFGSVTTLSYLTPDSGLSLLTSQGTPERRLDSERTAAWPQLRK